MLIDRINTKKRPSAPGVSFGQGSNISVDASESMSRPTWSRGRADTFCDVVSFEMRSKQSPTSNTNEGPSDVMHGSCRRLEPQSGHAATGAKKKGLDE